MKFPNYKELKEKTIETYKQTSKKALIFSHVTWGFYYLGSLYFFPTESYNFERFIIDYSLSYGIFLGSYAFYAKFDKA